MPNNITPPKSNIPIGRVAANGVDVDQHPEFVRYFFDLLKRVGGTTAQTITDLMASIADIFATMLTATYDDAHDHRVLSIRSANGAELAIDEMLCWDINYWLTRAEIVDSRRQNGPTLNLTTQIQFAIDS